MLARNENSHGGGWSLTSNGHGNGINGCCPAMETAMVVGGCWPPTDTAMELIVWPAVETTMVVGGCWPTVETPMVVGGCWPAMETTMVVASSRATMGTAMELHGCLQAMGTTMVSRASTYGKVLWAKLACCRKTETKRLAKKAWT